MKIDFNRSSHLWRSINSQWHRHVHELLVANDLTHVDRMVLLALNNLDSPSKSEIAASINVKPQNLTRAIQRLIDRSYIKKSENIKDKRFARFSLCPGSRSIVRKLVQQNEQLWLTATKGISAQALEQFNEQLELMLNNLKES